MKSSNYYSPGMNYYLPGFTANHIIVNIPAKQYFIGIYIFLLVNTNVVKQLCTFHCTVFGFKF